MATPTRGQPPVITVQEITAEEFPEFQRVNSAAFGVGSWGLAPLLWPKDPNTSAEEHLAINARIQEDLWKSDPSAKYMTAKYGDFLISLPSGKIVGIAKWNFFLDSGPQYPWPTVQPPGAQVERVNIFFGALDKVRNETMKDKRHVLMAILAIDPEYQRMGIGGKLLEWGLERCDAQGLDCWIDATKAGRGLYEKFGWKEVASLDIDLGKWGGESGKINKTSNMLRLARPVKGSS